jgi:predicted transport protein
LKVDVAYPFLMELYHDYAIGMLSKSDFLAAVRLVESYVFRRSICAVPTNSTNKTFATFAKALKKDRYLESIQAQFLGMSSYRRFPDDDEFQRDLQTRDLYTGNTRRSYWLRRLENHGRKERVAVDEYTIEHILPQNDNLSQTWKTELGPEWERVRNTWLHTIGNLTLTGYNSEYSDRPFSEKRDMKGGFKVSPLKLNDGLGQLVHWDENAIKSRAERLAAIALDVWTSPRLQPDVLAGYKLKAPTTSYSLHDHPQLLAGPMHDLFEAFRKEVIALDPCVTEEVFKTCIAYKAETNFVDLVPQLKRLQLTLNMPFGDIDDPKGLCEDVSDIGHLGYGDIKVTMSSLLDIPYVMGLVRQSFDRQMGNGSGM